MNVHKQIKLDKNKNIWWPIFTDLNCGFFYSIFNLYL